MTFGNSTRVQRNGPSFPWGDSTRAASTEPKVRLRLATFPAGASWPLPDTTNPPIRCGSSVASVMTPAAQPLACSMTSGPTTSPPVSGLGWAPPTGRVLPPPTPLTRTASMAPLVLQAVDREAAKASFPGWITLETFGSLADTTFLAPASLTPSTTFGNSVVGNELGSAVQAALTRLEIMAPKALLHPPTSQELVGVLPLGQT